MSDPDALALFTEPARAWFRSSLGEPTPVQNRGWTAVAAGHHTLMLAPTGSGKTLAAFFFALDRLARDPSPPDDGGTRVLYISPIKALAYDIERNLRAPLAGLQRLGAATGVTVDVRTGDTPPKDRERQRRHPGQVLITTPESLYLLLAGRARDRLRAVDTVIIDEIHALATTKRGVHLALSLERLSVLVTGGGKPEPQRIGLSATQRPLSEVARYLGGDRPVEIVDAGARPSLDLEIVVPTVDMETPSPPPVRSKPRRGPKKMEPPGRPDAREHDPSWRPGVLAVPLPEAGIDGVGSAHAGSADEGRRGLIELTPRERGERGGGMWPVIYAKLLDLVLEHRTTIVFVNSRRLAERVAQALTELAASLGLTPEGVELVRAHHGSVARHARVEIEESLKAGRLRAITATSSLELGIDMGSVDLVVQLESPGSVSRGLQRIGRASHHVGGTSRGRILPKFRGDLLEATVVARRMLDGEVESIRVPDSALDVLAQQIVAMVAVDPWQVDELERVIHRAASYRELSRTVLVGVIDMLAGRYPSDAFAELRPRLTWDRQTDVLTPRKGARMLSVVSGGTIPDRGTFAVHIGDGPRIGELDEEMVAESRKGETFLLGASTWRIEDITRDRVIVSPAPGEPGKMPFWRGEGPGRPIELGRALGAFCGDLDARLATNPAAARAWLRSDYRLDANAADNLARYLEDQRAATGAVPTDRAITIERFRDELGDPRVCILSPFGSRVHAPWALVIARKLEQELGYSVHPLWTDDGIALRFADGDALPEDDLLIPEPEDVEDALVAELARSSVFASHFRENAARALLLPRRRPGQRTPLWAQRLRAQQLMGVALQYPAFPITLETYRECLRDVFDVPALTELLGQIRSRAVRVEAAETSSASPFARSLVFDYVAAFLYEGDAPLAERKAQALTLDRALLRELIGGGELRDLLDADVLEEVEAELQLLADGRRARDADELHDVLRRIGDLDEAELAARSELDRGDGTAGAPGHHDQTELQAALAQLDRTRRIARVRIAGAERWIAAEDAARYRDGLGIALPGGLPAALLEPATAPLESLVARYARTHAPFIASGPAARWGVPPAQIETILTLMAARGQLDRGPMRPITSKALPPSHPPATLLPAVPLGGWNPGIDSCDPDVLRQIRRRTLFKLRSQIAPVDAPAYAAFLPRWHGLDAPRRGLGALRDAITRLEGVALPFSELERRILPARVLDYHPRMLDELGAAGELAWIGSGALGTKDGRVILVARERARALAPDPQPLANPSPLHDAILAHLRASGASFLVAIETAVGKQERGSVAAALWDLVWAGLLTNDTFAPLRSLGAPASRRGSAYASFGGRWSLVESLGPAPTGTARGLAQANGLLSRWGIASRPGARADETPGGFAAVSDVFRALEDAGSVRRGYFVDSLEGAQFAWPGAIDRLREPVRPIATGDRLAPRVDVLAAVDPALAYGAALPWPELRDASARPARRVGASAVLVGGALALYVEPKGRRVLTAPVPDETIELALAVGLPQLAARTRRRELVIEQIDDLAAAQSPFSRALLAAGARVDYRGLTIRGQLPSARAAAEPEAEAEADPDDEGDDPAVPE